MSGKRYWLMKSEPHTYSFEELQQDKVACWEGVRNYQARNFMRDDMKIGDGVLYYHSSCKVPGVVGIAKVVKEAYPDYYAWDKASDYFDEKASPENPRWVMVDVAYEYHLKEFVPLADIRQNPKLADMKVIAPRQRLSVQPVLKAEFDEILKMGGGTA